WPMGRHEGQTRRRGTGRRAGRDPNRAHRATDRARPGRGAARGDRVSHTDRAMSYVIAVANQKGGVGKTTTAINLAASLAATKRRVRLVDVDAQGNATMGVGVDKARLERTGRDVLLEQVPIRDAIVPLDSLSLALLPANGDMTEAEIKLRDVA